MHSKMFLTWDMSSRCFIKKDNEVILFCIFKRKNNFVSLCGSVRFESYNKLANFVKSYIAENNEISL